MVSEVQDAAGVSPSDIVHLKRLRGDSLNLADFQVLQQTCQKLKNLNIEGRKNRAVVEELKKLKLEIKKIPGTERGLGRTIAKTKAAQLGDVVLKDRIELEKLITAKISIAMSLDRKKQLRDKIEARLNLELDRALASVPEAVRQDKKKQGAIGVGG